MSYQTALPIANVIKDIHAKKYLLPSIQREFVWNPAQIEKLFDSLMRDYPISSFLFWKVSKDRVKDFQFYEFLRSYHEKNNRHNPKANVKGEEEIIAVLDGQQRLTSIYIGLKGIYAYKLPKKRWDNELAYPKRRLYLNLLSPSEDQELEFDFEFLTEEEAIVKDTNTYWFAVGDILDLKELHEVNEYMINRGLFSDYGREKAAFANRALSKLHSVIHVKPTISYYLEESEKLDKVLNIFIRINSGGTILSYSDLLLSIATAQWEEKDAREEITTFVDEINNIGNGFNFNKDFVLKTCLVLSDFTDVAFKVDNFNKSNMLKIEKNWEDISNAIRLAVKLVHSYGYNRDTLTSTNAIIPIAYYLLKIGLPDNFDLSNKVTTDRNKIKQWLILTLLKRVFSGTPDNLLRQIRKVVSEEFANGFPLEKIINAFKGTPKTLIFSNEDIENLLWSKYGQPSTFSILALLYPSLDFRNKFHIDHIFPKSAFTQRKLKKRGVAENDIEEYMSLYDYIGNLQLLEALPNIQKQDRDFDVWLSEFDIDEQGEFNKRHYIPKEDLTFGNFVKAFKKREELIIKKLKGIVQVEIGTEDSEKNTE